MSRDVNRGARPSPARLLEDHVIFDSDVLVCFAQIGRSQLIRSGFVGRVEVPRAIEVELKGLSQGHPDLAHLLRPDCFGHVHDLTHAEAERAAEHQRAWVGYENWVNNPKWHRGEAECLRLALRRELAQERTGKPAAFVVHDRDARNAARPYGIETFSAVEVLAALAAAGHLLPENAWQRWVDMIDGGYVARLPGWTRSDEDRSRFMQLVEDFPTGATESDPS